uniref:Cyclotide trypsin inhibitor TopI1 n=1 Tax=Tityus obscurus TaxID=1221240 RepID=CYCTI_TITOB|nr:RecName: Full=Cyclotide trypsin inhibitor TopI1; Flags: Precursor [Tityus obscurus]
MKFIIVLLLLTALTLTSIPVIEGILKRCKTYDDCKDVCKARKGKCEFGICKCMIKSGK